MRLCGASLKPTLFVTTSNLRCELSDQSESGIRQRCDVTRPKTSLLFADADHRAGGHDHRQQLCHRQEFRRGDDSRVSDSAPLSTFDYFL